MDEVDRSEKLKECLETLKKCYVTENSEITHVNLRYYEKYLIAFI